MNFVICNKSTDCFQKNVIYECTWAYGNFYNGLTDILNTSKEFIPYKLDNDNFTFIFNADKKLQDYIFGAYEKWDYDLGCVVNG